MLKLGKELFRKDIQKLDEGTLVYIKYIDKYKIPRQEIRRKYLQSCIGYVFKKRFSDEEIKYEPSTMQILEILELPKAVIINKFSFCDCGNSSYQELVKICENAEKAYEYIKQNTFENQYDNEYEVLEEQY